MPILASTLKVEWFTSIAYRAVFKLVQLEKAVFTRATLKRALLQHLKSVESNRVLFVKIDKIFNIDVRAMSVRSFRSHSKLLYDMHLSRTVLENAYGMLRRAMKEPAYTVNQLQMDAKGIYRAASVLYGEGDSRGDILEDFEARYRDLRLEQDKSGNEKKQNINTGLVKFDRVTGGVLPGEFGVIAGRPAVGKTAALVSFAVHAWREHNTVLFISGEMQKRDIMHRIDSNISGIPSQRFRLKALEEDDFYLWDRTVHNLRRQAMPPLEIAGMNRNFTVQSIIDEIDRVEEKWAKKVNLICLDYLNIMRHANGSSGDWNTYADVVWDIKALCEDRQIVCWTACQITDEGIRSEKLNLSHIKYARAIGETAPIVVGLVASESDQWENRIQLQVLKLRNSPSVGESIPLNPNMELMRIHCELEEKENYLDTL